MTQQLTKQKPDLSKPSRIEELLDLWLQLAPQEITYIRSTYLFNKEFSVLKITPRQFGRIPPCAAECYLENYIHRCLRNRGWNYVVEWYPVNSVYKAGLRHPNQKEFESSSIVEALLEIYIWGLQNCSEEKKA